MNLSGLTNLCVPVPPIPEQKVISDSISAQTTQLDALIVKVRTAIERLQEYRTALISAAVTGQIDVRSHATAVGI
jgi:restriction endonuclease S subunit